MFDPLRRIFAPFNMEITAVFDGQKRKEVTRCVVWNNGLMCDPGWTEREATPSIFEQAVVCVRNT